MADNLPDFSEILGWIKTVGTLIEEAPAEVADLY
jgi:hypothetical protein